MNSHLSDEQMTECLLGTAAPELAQHMVSCAECSSELGDLRSALTSYATATRNETSRAVLPRHSFARSSGVFAGHSLAWAAALVLFAFSTMLLRFSPAPRPHTAIPTNSQSASYSNTTNYDNDDALLLSIQHDLESDVPQALAPATLLTAERNRVILNTREGTRNR